MIKEVLQSIKGIEIYPIISLIVFFLFFIGVGFFLIKMNKSHINKMKHLPLNNDNSQNLNSGEINDKIN